MEFVYVVPRETLFPACLPQGLTPFASPADAGVDGALPRARFLEIVAEHGFFVERAWAERTPAYKQIIPYTVFHRAAEHGPDADEVFVMRRKHTGGEARLHGKHSIGVGGHLEPTDLDGACRKGIVERGTRREIAEEVAVEGELDLRAVGILNDDSNPVGAVHVGLVQIARCSGDVSVRETDQLEGRFMSLEELRRLHRGGTVFETWSSILIDRLDSVLQPVPIRV